jgi:hypothetical protein
MVINRRAKSRDPGNSGVLELMRSDHCWADCKENCRHHHHQEKGQGQGPGDTAGQKCLQTVIAELLPRESRLGAQPSKTPSPLYKS